ncbi:MAG: hypothetical protein CMQ43_10580 [Gammaproteobacteria bacterium]|jgi:hypothetical protein|nr:hypothetical protein [Gammaproteobacteria bacterium]|tara:strand:+ start:1843 stop:2169 length:327 start_codon:yes stop_codon:yes gene_type:complete
MTELPKDIEALEELFERHHIARRHLRPRWMRLCRSMGLDPKPPLFFSLAEHYLWEGLPSMAIAVAGYLACWWLLGTPLAGLAVLIAVCALLPAANWAIRRQLKGRLSG